MSPIQIRNVKLKNRLVFSPMCQYIAKDGFADDWHLVHLGSRAVGGAGLVFVEATAVVPEGRISYGDMGLWDDEHISPLARVAAFIKRVGSVPAIQLAHAGRKASCRQPWDDNGSFITQKDGGWPIVAPSAIPFYPENEPPRALEKSEIPGIIAKFVAAAKRALKAGFEVIEIHSAHGYLSHSFLSPISNQRTDEYGGSLENRMRFTVQLAREVRQALPEGTPLFVRISATDWVENGWDLEQSIALAEKLKPLRIDVIDCSSGALVPYAKIPVKPGYQVPFAAAIRERVGIKTAAVGLITQAQQANEIITSGSADLVFVAREFMRNPYFGLQSEKALDHEESWPLSYGYALRRR